MFEQERFVVRLQQRVMQESDIVACFLAGSFGRRTQDAFSDLDVALIFGDDPGRDKAWSRRREFIQSVLPYLPAKSFDASHVRPYFHIALYSNGSKVDYRYESQTSLQPNPWDKEIRLLKDPAGWGEKYQAACLQTGLPQPHFTAEELTDLDNRFWIMFWDIYRQLWRGQSDKSFTIYLELLHFTLPALLRMLPPEDPTYRPLLQASYSQATPPNLMEMHRLMTVYLQTRAALIRRYNLLFTPNQAFERAIQQLIERRK